MKKVSYLFLSLAVVALLQSSAFSQITLTTSDLPNFFGVGKSWLSYSKSDTTVTMNIGIASSVTPQSWTPPVVVFTDSSRSDNVLPSSTPYAADFPGAAYAQTSTITQTGITIQFYQFISLSNDSLINIGMAEHAYGSIKGTAIDTNIISYEKKFDVHLPIQLGGSTSSSSDTTSIGGGFRQVVTTTETYDAFGTLNLPNGSFQALRSKTVETTNVYNGSTLTNSYSHYSYSWITREGHQLQVSADTGSGSGSVTLTSVSVTYSTATPVTAVKALSDVPARFALEQNYPNPFNPSTAIQFQITNRGAVRLTVFNVLGEEVATLVNETLEPGTYTARWNAASMPSGAYVYRLQAGNAVGTKKMLFLK